MELCCSLSGSLEEENSKFCQNFVQLETQGSLDVRFALVKQSVVSDSSVDDPVFLIEKT